MRERFHIGSVNLSLPSIEVLKVNWYVEELGKLKQTVIVWYETN